MSIRKLAMAAAATAAFGLGTQQASAFNGPFYQCVETDLVRFDGSIVDAAIATPELSTLVTAVTVAGLVDTLATVEEATVYAPTDTAFGNVPAPLLDEILADTDVLTQVLTYHVTPGKADPRKFFSPTLADTLQGQEVTLNFRNGAPHVNQAQVACQGVQVNNGIVWIIDSVLLPQF